MSPPQNPPPAARAPASSLPLALVAWGVVALVVALTVWAMFQVKAAMTANGFQAGWADALLVGTGLLPLALLIPANAALRHALAAQSALRAGDLIGARVSGAAGRDQGWFTLGYAAAFVLGVVLVMFFIANNVAVGKTFFDLRLIWKSADLIVLAFLINVYIFLAAGAATLVWGLVVAIAKLLPGRAAQPIRFIATAYTDIMLSLPGIIVIYLVGFGLPLTGIPLFRNLPLEVLAILALTLTYGAYVGEVYRAGLESIHPSQWSAARSLGLSYGQTLRFVIVPQAVRRVIPPLLNNFIGMQKDTSLVSVVGVIDAFNQSRIIASNNFNLSAVTTVAILFVLITIPQTRLVDRMMAEDRRKMRA